ncbi:predicted protein [Plenodomus lingam JN3]|uniref:Predicted protein n=1 Tax=Leptosphaeria maculans (strain JN3 / isolate v23.1.3 / race Av1-4-5-6-7-8) TaxID=985895 RepID=E4ZMV2_LEPMJ|nr:predicted protein [Plenodomus lingam JN3]CBX92555.1 predicted protein [Plenodomus lingam JN3]
MFSVLLSARSFLLFFVFTSSFCVIVGVVVGGEDAGAYAVGCCWVWEVCGWDGVCCFLTPRSYLSYFLAYISF